MLRMSGAVLHPVLGRRERRKQTTRTQLLAAGRQLFGDKGLYESRIEDLANVAGIAKGTLYGYFADKEALVQAVVEAGFDELLAHVEAAARSAGIRRTEAIARAHLEFFAANPDFMRIFHQVRGLLKFGRLEWLPLRVSLERYIARLAKLINGSPRRGREPARRSLERARLLLGAISGMTSVLASLEFDLEEVLEDGEFARTMSAVARATARHRTGSRRPARRRAGERKTR